MEEDNGLDLTLSLPCGGPSGSKGKNESGLDTKSQEEDRGSKLIDDFKNFLDGGTHKEENLSKPEENLFYDLSNNRSSEVHEERRQEAVNKRKNLFDKRNEREAHVKARTSHISVDEGSMTENEDMADSEADGSTSKLAQHRDDASKRHAGDVGLAEGAKEAHGVPDSSGVNLQGQRRFTVSAEKEFKVGHASYGVPFSGQPTNILNMPYPLSTKESNSNAVSGTVTTGYTLPSAIPVMAPASNERPGSQQSVIPANLPLMFGYSPVQVSAATTPGNAPRTKEEGPSIHTEAEVKGINGVNIAKSPNDQPRADGCPPEHPAIKPGIAAELKFGGTGSPPNLPWVSTTGSGPTGKTISGVTYRYSGTQIRIVCACHGSHMSPEDFVQHANEEPPNTNGGGPGGSGLAATPNGNAATSAQN